MALWQFCAESAGYIFGNTLTEVQQKIVNWLLEQKQFGRPPQNKTAIRQGALGGRAKVKTLAEDMVILTKAEFVEVQERDGHNVYVATGKK
jgi:hypothetical protein